MRSRSLAVATLLVASSPALAQGDQAGFLVRLGTDTVAVERVVRSDDRIEGWLATRNPSTAMRHYVATLAPDGSVKELTYDVTSVALNQPATKAVLRFDADTAVVDIDVPRDTTLHVAAMHGLPYVNFSYGLLEQTFRWARAQREDSLVIPMVFVGAPRAEPATVRRLGGDSMTFAIFEPTPSRARFDASGRLLALGGQGTTQGVVVTRLPDVDVRGIAAGWAKAEAGGRPAGQLSPLDSVKASAGGANIAIVYSRPSRRGRTIFGGVVPFDAVWRTGANAATMFTTDADLAMNGTTIPKGSYTLWTLPTRSGATLILNKQTGQWGTEYDAAQDLARIPLQVTRLPEQVERFTIAVEPAGNGGTLTYSWGDRAFSAPFTVSRR